MNSADYTLLLNQPDAVNDRQTDALEKIVTEFPYFQSARALRLKGLYSQNSFQYNFALKVAAAYTTDRGVLFDFITSDTFTTINKGLYDQKIAELHSIEVKESHVIVEQNNEPAVDKVEQSILSSIKESGAGETELLEKPQEVIAEPINDFVETEAVEDVIIESTEENLAEIPAVDTFEEIEFVPVQESLPEVVDEPVAGIEPTITENSNEKTEEITVGGPEIHPSENEQPKQTPEQKLHIGEPLEFSKTETHSFQEWLQLSRIQPIQREEKEEIKSEPEATSIEENVEDVAIAEIDSTPTEDEMSDAKSKKSALIDRFIENNPKIPQMKPEAEAPVIPEPKEDHSALMTETLARVYLEQKKYQKAIQAYEILILKYPEKSSFFADRISEIKNLQQNNIVK